ncbi:MAG: glycosyltransferase [Pleurocapsa sp.]
MKQPWLSIVIPTYNGEKYLAATLDSVVLQNDDDIECIVIDDGSTDATLSIVSNYQDRLKIEIIERKRGNWVANTNYGLSVARGTYACFLHQDDRWEAGRLAVMKKAIASYPSASLYLHPSLFIDTNGDRLGVWNCPFSGKDLVVIDSETAVERLLVQNFIAIPAPIFKRQVALNLGAMDEKLWYTADWDFWLKLAASGDTVYCPEPLAAFRVHPESQTIRRSSSVEDFYQQMRSVFEEHLTTWEADLGRKLKTGQLALFSTEVNKALAAIIHGEKANLWKLGLDFIALTPTGWYRYFRDSRIIERVIVRLKAKLQTSG